MRVHVSQSYCSHLPVLLPSPSPVPFPVSVFIAAAERPTCRSSAHPPLLFNPGLVSSPVPDVPLHPPAPLRSASCSTVILSSLHAVPRQPCLPPSLPYVCHFPQGTPSKINSFPP